jgi:hypothetical protein
MKFAFIDEEKAHWPVEVPAKCSTFRAAATMRGEVALRHRERSKTRSWWWKSKQRTPLAEAATAASVCCVSCESTIGTLARSALSGSCDGKLSARFAAGGCVTTAGLNTLAGRELR